MLDSGLEGNKMSIPGFTAEASMYNMAGRYDMNFLQSFSSGSGVVMPQARPMIDRCNHYCDTHGAPPSCYEWCDKTWR